MGGELLAWLPLLVKLALTAAIVVTASVMTERAGPLIGALIVTLPVTVWPAYVFLALDHDAGFIAESALSGLVINAVSGIYLLVYALLARRMWLAAALPIALSCWIGLAVFATSLPWTYPAAVLFNLVVYPACLWLGHHLRETQMPQLRREWYEIPFRTLLVCALMATVLLVSKWAGPTVTGLFAVFPISTTSAILILHPRIGGHATSAMIANGLWGMFGISLGLMALPVGAPSIGVVLALALALAIPMTWNLSVWIIRTRSARAGAAVNRASPPPAPSTHKARLSPRAATFRRD